MTSAPERYDPELRLSGAGVSRRSLFTGVMSALVSGALISKGFGYPNATGETVRHRLPAGSGSIPPVWICPVPPAATSDDALEIESFLLGVGAELSRGGAPVLSITRRRFSDGGLMPCLPEMMTFHPLCLYEDNLDLDNGRLLYSVGDHINDTGRFIINDAWPTLDDLDGLIKVRRPKFVTINILGDLFAFRDGSYSGHRLSPEKEEEELTSIATEYGCLILGIRQA
jgi:hypothetical protein